MSSGQIHIGDIGTIFKRTITDSTTGLAVDCSGATTKQMIFRKPSGTLLTKTASFTSTGVDGNIQYATIADDLDTVGEWNVEVYVVLTGGAWHSDSTVFTVVKNL